MNLLNLPCHSVRISMYRIQDKLFALSDPSDGIVPLYIPDNPVEFHPYLLIRDTHPLRRLIISQLPQMNQQRQHIIPIPEGYKVIGKSFRIYLHFPAAD